jgi:hypothetical protein
MPTLLEIRDDPNFVNANAETKAAIFAKWAPQDPNFSGANPETQAAIKAKFGLASAAAEPSLWQKARPYVAPALEAVGAAGGGIVGAAGGPLGAVAGAGLGYAGAKELLNIGDTYLGGQPAATPANAMRRVGGNLAEGGMFEMGGQLIAKPLGYAMDKGINAILNISPINKAANIVRGAVGADRPAVVNALTTAPADVTAAQAVAGQNLPEVQALTVAAAARNPKPFDAVLAQQKAQTISELEALAQGSTQTEARAAQEATKKAVKATLIPQRDLALQTANIAGNLKPGLDARAAGLEGAAADATDMVRRLVPAGERALGMPAATIAPQPGMPKLPEAFGGYTYMGEMKGIADKWASKAADASLDLGAGARFAKYASDSLAAHGLQPLESAPIISGIKSAAGADAYAGNIQVRNALSEVADEIAKYTNSGGIIHGEALDAIRKNSVNAVIQKNLAGADPKAQQKAASEVLGQIKPLIDDAIEKAGGTGYKDYLASYAGEMQDIARTKLAGKALDLYKSSPDQFVKMVNGDAPKAVEKILGPGHYDIANELSPDAYAVLKRAADGITQAKEMADQAGKGVIALNEVIRQNTHGIRLPPTLTHTGMAANAALGVLESRVNQKTMNVLSDAMQHPETAANLLTMVPAADRTALRRFLTDNASWLPPTLTGSMAAITPDRRNALAPDNRNAMTRN